jgi:hypothetical protein
MYIDNNDIEDTSFCITPNDLFDNNLKSYSKYDGTKDNDTSIVVGSNPNDYPDNN